MAQQVTLGGDRLGSGNKQKVNLHDYEMTSFNLEQDFKSSMAPGILYPFIKLLGTNHDTFDIDLDSFVRTLPTKGPLFGSFKLQLDIFEIPIRLYQGILHNNPLAIGMKMNQVYLPKIKVKTIDGANAPRRAGSNDYNRQINESALLKYLGLSGVGTYSGPISNPTFEISRKINAVPALAYYDIFKCYYSNKQEENAYVIVPGNIVNGPQLEATGPVQIGYNQSGGQATYNQANWTLSSGTLIQTLEIPEDYQLFSLVFPVKATNFNEEDISITIEATNGGGTIIDCSLKEAIDTLYLRFLQKDDNGNYWYGDTNQLRSTINDNLASGEDTSIALSITADTAKTNADIELQSFPLANIDEMRNRLLSSNTLGDEFVIDNTTDLLPYSALVNQTNDGITWNAFIDNGLVVKTYQSDLFNNWLNTEWVDGENGIAALTAVPVDDGAFLLDSLNLAEKLYELYNRVAVSGGTYEDWQEAVYGEGAVRKAESPIYIGGMSAEVMFEEVISTAETNVEQGEKLQPLGSLGGKGTMVGSKGGNNIHVKCTEPCYIMGIASLTPRIAYSQGNDWDLTEIDTLDDLHKPQLDGIGFQNLMTEQLAWWDRNYRYQGGSAPVTRTSVGKQTAWINYQTAVDKVYGDFAKQDGYAFMVLNRNYEIDPSNRAKVADLTTYIDPAKFNYAFAYTDLAAQNFWVQIHSRVIARRKMGAQQIPNM